MKSDSIIKLVGHLSGPAIKRPFPSGVSLDPGEEIRLTTGIGTDTESGVFWGREVSVWNDGGDTVTVKAPDGTVVAERSYS